MNPSHYELGRIAVDAVIFTIVDDQLKIYTHEREVSPYLGIKELLGGIVLKDETAEQTLKRKLKSTLGDVPYYFSQFHTFTDPKRDPRTRTISIAYLALVNPLDVTKPNDWMALKNLPKLAFDHDLIVKKAYSHLKKNVDSLIMKQFMPKYFPLNTLQKAYEIILDTKLDNRNFRRKMLESGVVKETKKREEGVKHRPAKLFQFR